MVPFPPRSSPGWRRRWERPTAPSPLYRNYSRYRTLALSLRARSLLHFSGSIQCSIRCGMIRASKNSLRLHLRRLTNKPTQGHHRSRRQAKATICFASGERMLRNEFLKEHRNVAERQSTIAELKRTVAQQQKQIEALTATVRKVSER